MLINNGNDEEEWSEDEDDNHQTNDASANGQDTKLIAQT